MADLDQIAPMTNDEYLRPWWWMADDLRAWLARETAEERGPTRAICLPHDDRALGRVAVRLPQFASDAVRCEAVQTSDQPAGELSYWLLPDARGRGLAFAAVTQMMKIAADRGIELTGARHRGRKRCVDTCGRALGCRTPAPDPHTHGPLRQRLDDGGLRSRRCACYRRALRMRVSGVSAALRNLCVGAGRSALGGSMRLPARPLASIRAARDSGRSPLRIDIRCAGPLRCSPGSSRTSALRRNEGVPPAGPGYR